MNVIFFRKRNEFHTITNHRKERFFFDSEPNLTKPDTNFFIFDTFSVTYFALSLVKHSIDH